MLSPFSKDVFVGDWVGVVKFSRNARGAIGGFTVLRSPSAICNTSDQRRSLRNQAAGFWRKVSRPRMTEGPIALEPMEVNGAHPAGGVAGGCGAGGAVDAVGGTPDGSAAAGGVAERCR